MEKIPTLIVSGFVILTAIICWFSGIILSTLVNQHKQDFEYQTQMVTNRYKDLFPEKKEGIRPGRIIQKSRVEIWDFARLFYILQGSFFDVECLTILGLFGIIQEL